MCVKDDIDKIEEGAGKIERNPNLPSSPMERICENTETRNNEELLMADFVPIIRSGEWSDIGSRDYMEDAHVCIGDLAKKFGYLSMNGEAISFYGVFDGHGGKGAAHFVRDNLPRVIVEDADFPLQLEKVVTRSFMQIDTQFAQTCSVHASLSSGTTALTAMIFGSDLDTRCGKVLRTLVVSAPQKPAEVAVRTLATEWRKERLSSLAIQAVGV